MNERRREEEQKKNNEREMNEDQEKSMLAIAFFAYSATIIKDSIYIN